MFVDTDAVSLLFNFLDFERNVDPKDGCENKAAMPHYETCHVISISAICFDQFLSIREISPSEGASTAFVLAPSEEPTSLQEKSFKPGTHVPGVSLHWQSSSKCWNELSLFLSEIIGFDPPWFKFDLNALRSFLNHRRSGNAAKPNIISSNTMTHHIPCSSSSEVMATFWCDRWHQRLCNPCW